MSSEMCSGVSFCGAPAGAHPGHIQGARPEKDPRAAGVLRGVRRTSDIALLPECDAHRSRASSSTSIVSCAVRRHEDLAFPCPRAAAVWRYSIQVFGFK